MGDISSLSKETRVLLDDAGLENTKIIVSGDLEEYKIAVLKREGSPVDLWRQNAIQGLEQFYARDDFRHIENSLTEITASLER